jgi:predicted DNA-binding transcriptional regulator YafY
MNINKPQHARLLFIDEKIRSGSFPNATSLSNEYEVSSRTITRDIEYMRDSLKAPVEYDPVHKGYYYTESNFFLPAIDIRESDFFAICITEKALKQYENTPLYDKLSGVFNRLKEFLPESIRVNTTWIDTHFSFMHESFTTIDPEIWETVSRGLRQCSSLNIVHRKAGSADAVERTVDPYHIVNYRGEWYLIGYCHKRKSILRFAISRIRKAELTSKKYVISPDFNFDTFIGTSFGIMTEETEHHVKIRFDNEQAPYIVERQWQPGQNITHNQDGTVVLSFNSNSLYEVKRWVLSWGPSAKVLEPKELIDQVKKDAAALGDIYR